MPGLLAVSWRVQDPGNVNELFDRARDAYSRLTNLPCASEIKEPGFRVVRFPGTQSPYPDLCVVPEAGLTVGTAGWWFDSATAEHVPASPRILAERFSREGERALDSLQGQYLAVVLDSRTGVLTATTDRLGWFPVYLAEGNGAAWISTSALALAVALQPRLDVDALRTLFMGNPIRSPRSAFVGIRRVGFGERVRLEDGRSRVSRTWVPFAPPRVYGTVEEAAEEGVALLRRSCRRVQQAWPRWVSDLTSGLDSRLLVAGMAANGGPVNVTVTGPETHYDVRIARAIAGRFGWSLHHYYPGRHWGRERWHFFERGVALADGELPGHAVDRVLHTKTLHSRTFDAALSGAGGEFFREYAWQQEFFKIGRTSTLDLSRVMRYRFFFSSRPEASLFRSDFGASCIADHIRLAREITDLAPDALNTAKLDAIYVWRYSAGAGRNGAIIYPIVPSPFPLATPELVEFSLAVPWRFRMAARLSRQMIMRLAPGLAAMPTWYGGNAEVLRLARPRQYAAYAYVAAKKLVRKMGQVTVRRAIFPDPVKLESDPAWDREFVRVLDERGLLKVENLVTAGLYRLDGLRRLLSRATDQTFDGHDQLFTILSIEVLCRLTGITPTEQL